MLAKKFRLSIPEFYARKEKNEIARSTHLAARWSRTELPFSRFGVVVKKTEEKRASRRNKVRRAVFDAVRLSRAHLIKGRDVIISARAALFDLPPRYIRSEVEKMIQKIFSGEHI